MATNISLILAFGAGLLSFISPCTLPLYPGFLSYITGISLDELKEKRGMFRRTAITHTLLFLLGFSIIFLALGLSTTLLSALFYQYQSILRKVGAILIFVFGLMVVGIFTPRFLMKDRKISFSRRPSGYFGSVIIGIGFAAGWTPCTGPILAGVIAMGVTDPSHGLLYMIVYTLGFAIPFFLLSLFIDRIQWIKRYNQIITKVGGVVMIIMAILLYFNLMTKITSFLVNRVFGGFTGF